MELLLAIIVGTMVSVAVYLMLDRSLMRFLFGLSLISNAANLLIFASGRLTSGVAPLVPAGEKAPVREVANSLPQALVLTAIVIGFGLFAFSLVLTLRAYRDLGTLHTDEMRVAEPPSAETGTAPKPGST